MSSRKRPLQTSDTGNEKKRQKLDDTEEPIKKEEPKKDKTPAGV